MKKLLFIALFIIGCVSTPPKPPPPQSTMDVIEEELAGWGGADELFDARWANWKVGYNKDEGNLYIQVAAQPSANDIAMSGYLDIIKDIHKKYASSYNLVGRVHQWGEQKKSCYVKGR